MVGVRMSKRAYVCTCVGVYTCVEWVVGWWLMEKIAEVYMHSLTNSEPKSDSNHRP